MWQVNGFITVQEAAEKWGVTPRQIQILCKANRIVRAMRMSRIGIIPEAVEKPTKDNAIKARQKMIDNNLTMIDLFAGAGGLSEGLSEAGFHSLFASENP